MKYDVVFISVKEYEKLVNRSQKTVYRWIDQRKIRARQLAPHHEWEIELPTDEYERLKDNLRHKKSS
jgi:hypothetical protein